MTNPTEKEMTFFPRYNNPVAGPIASTNRPRSAVTNSSNSNSQRKQLKPVVSHSASEIPATSTSPTEDPAGVMDKNLKNPTRFRRLPGKLKPRPNAVAAPVQPANQSLAEVLMTKINNAEHNLELTKDDTIKIKDAPRQGKKKLIQPKQFVPPNASAYARNAAGTVGKKPTPTPIFTKTLTQVVLAPRFPPDKPNAIKSYVQKSKTIQGRRTDIWSRPSDTNQTIIEDSYPMIKMSADMFPPEKARWVQLALEKLLISGTITAKQMNTPAFQRKIGNLYDSTVDKRSLKVGSYVNTLLQQSSTGSASSLIPRKTTPPAQSPTTSLLRPTTPKNSPRTPKPGTPTNALKPATPSTPRSAKSSQKGSVSLDEHPAELQRTVSDILLHMLLKGMMVDHMNKIPNKDASDTPNSSTNYLGALEKRSISTNTDNDDYMDDWAWMARASRFKRGNSTNTTIADLTGSWIRATESFQDIKNCFVFEGKFCPMEASQKPISTFAPLSESRRRLYPTSAGYFRRLVDVRGFHPEEITIRYSKSRIFIEGKQTAAENTNYRLVREIVSLPRGLGIADLKVMRGRNNGRIVFEERVQVVPS